MGIFKLLQIETGFTDLMFPEFFQKVILVRKIAVKIERQILLAWRKTDMKPIGFRGFAPIAEAAKSDHCFTPHFW